MTAPVILVGDPSVGKTHLLSRYTRGTLPKTQATTIGVEFATHTVPLAVGGTVKAQIWDTGDRTLARDLPMSFSQPDKNGIVL